MSECKVCGLIYSSCYCSETTAINCPIGYQAIWAKRLPLDKEWWDSTEDDPLAIRIFVPSNID